MLPSHDQDQSSSPLPPDDNPILKSYESFVRDTPFVTRCLLQTQGITWLLSWFLDLGLAVGNVPQFTIFHFEIYRIFLSPFICTSLLSLVFCYLSFAEYGKRMEFDLGSTAFAILLATIGWVVNIVHLAVCFVLYSTDGSTNWLFMPCFGVWMLVFGLLSIECSQAPATSTRRLFVVDVPTRYYPLALVALFSLLGGFQLAYILAIGIGVAYRQGYLDKLKVDPIRIQSWERTTLEGYVCRQGWIANDASGRGDWEESSSGEDGVGLFSGLLSRQRPAPGGEQDSVTSVSGDSRPGRVIHTGTISSAPAKSSFPAGGGHQLGTASRRANPVDPRQARLEALERRMGTEKNDEKV